MSEYYSNGPNTDDEQQACNAYIHAISEQVGRLSVATNKMMPSWEHRPSDGNSVRCIGPGQEPALHGDGSHDLKAMQADIARSQALLHTHFRAGQLISAPLAIGTAYEKAERRLVHGREYSFAIDIVRLTGAILYDEAQVTTIAEAENLRPGVLTIVTTDDVIRETYYNVPVTDDNRTIVSRPPRLSELARIHQLLATAY